LRAARHSRRPRALGSGLPPLPVLPRLGGSRSANRGARHRSRLRRARPASSAIGRRHLFAHTYPITASERPALAARGVQVVDELLARFSVVGDRPTAVQLTNGGAIPRAAVFIRPTLHPRNDGL